MRNEERSTKPLSEKTSFTYADYAKWPDEERWELIDGQAHALAHSQSVPHQQLLVCLAYLVGQHFQIKPCQALLGPIDVLLPQGDEPDEQVDTVVEPDLLVVCDPAKMKERFIRGTPDLIVEILSESTVRRDLGEKLELYERHGVRCYLIVDPWGKTLTSRTLDEGGYFAHPEIFAGNDQVPVRIFPGLLLDLPRVFGNL